MKRKKLLSVMLAAAMLMGGGLCAVPAGEVKAAEEATRYPRVMEDIDRGLVAIPKTYGEEETGMYLSWRLLGTESLQDTRFDIYKNGKLLVSDYDGTNYTDTENVNGQDTSAVYQVVAGGTALTDDVLPANTILVNGKRVTLTMGYGCENSKYSQKNSYGWFDIPLQIPEAVNDETVGEYTYTANDCSVGDVDGDGQYELIVKWDPSNSRDNGSSGLTGDVLLSCYEFDGTQLWTQPINLGPNIRAGAHYTQFMVYDFDGDGCAELVMKTAPGSTDGEGNYVSLAGDNEEITGTDNTKLWRESSGHIISGPEYLTVFEGATGKALYTCFYEPSYEEGASTGNGWGDTYGNRGNRMLAAVGYFGNKDSEGNLLPSVVMCRGYYTKAYVVAYDWDGERLTQRFYHKGEEKGTDSLYGQGNHNLTVSDVDNDGYDEIVYGSAVLDHDGTVLANTQLGHGDALHVNDFNNDGEIEVFQVHEESTGYREYGGDFWKAATGEHIYGLAAEGDVGRGLMANVDDAYAAEHPNALSLGYTSSQSVIYDLTGAEVNSAPDTNNNKMINSLVYWDGDLGRELLDGGILAKYEVETGYTNRFYFDKTGSIGISTNNSSKSNACLTADIFGDWREEIIGRYGDSIRVFISTINTDYKLTTLMHDSQYRVSVATENVAYNQPPHTSYYIGTASLASETANYLAPAYAYTVMTVPVKELDTSSVKIKAYTGEYDGSAHGVAELTGLPKGARASYSISTDYDADTKEGTWSDYTLDMPEITNAGSVYVKVRLTAEGFSDWESEIIKAEVAMAQNAPDMPDKTIQASYEAKTVEKVELPEGWAWKNSETRLYVNEPTKSEAVYTGADADNYKVKEITVTITRQPAVFPFTDVEQDTWQYEGCYYAYQMELMSGVSDTEFTPGDKLTRAQFVTVLHNYAGTPECEFEECFTDVTDAGKWYAIPVVWAANEGITSGLPDGSFGVDEEITREQFVTMLYDYARSIGAVADTAEGVLTGYEDAEDVAEWAVIPMCWATKNGIVSGKPAADGIGTLLEPDGSTSRAECATIMMNFDKLVRGVE